ncbi:MAG: DUF559 domain-containing protein [Candidatus Aenigmarchaeota archaeon]|nr:DUF559 domain-containing protein [Candidatus Aenigmarchaeota archaeon]
MISWKKGLTAEKDERVRKSAEKLKATHSDKKFGFYKGMKPWNKNKTFPLESRKKMSESKKNLYAMGLLVPTNKGVPMTEEQKKRVSITKKRLYRQGKIKPWNKGKPMPKGAIEKMRKKLIGRKVWNTGLTKKTDVRVRKNAKAVSIANKKAYARPELKDMMKRRRLKQVFPTKDTKIEIMMKNELNLRGIEDFKMHIPIENTCQPDIVFLKDRLVVQCDGDWYHANPKRYNRKNLHKIQKFIVEKDKRQDKILRKSGWIILRFWESSIEKDVSKCADIIEKHLKR